MKTFIIGYIRSSGFDSMPRYRELVAADEDTARSTAETLLGKDYIVVDCFVDPYAEVNKITK